MLNPRKQVASGRGELACADRYGFVHDRANEMWGARLDVTTRLWKTSGHVTREPIAEGREGCGVIATLDSIAGRRRSIHDVEGGDVNETDRIRSGYGRPIR